MKIKALRGFLYNKQTIEPGRVIEVDDTFGAWAISKGKAEEVEGKGGKKGGPLTTEDLSAVKGK